MTSADVSSHANLARHALELLDAGKLDEWEDTMDPDCRFVAPGVALRGRAATREFVERFRRTFSDVHHTIDAVHVDGDTIVYEGVLVGTHTGPLWTPNGEIAPTGKRIRIAQAQIVEMRQGKAVAMRTYFDRMEMMGQLGLLPPPK